MNSTGPFTFAAPQAVVASTAATASGPVPLEHNMFSSPDVLLSSFGAASLPPRSAPVPHDFPFTFSYYADHEGSMAYISVPPDSAPLYMPGASDLSAAAINFGFALGTPETPENMSCPKSPHIDELVHFPDIQRVASSATNSSPQGFLSPSGLLEEAAGPSSTYSPPHPSSVGPPSFLPDTEPTVTHGETQLQGPPPSNGAISSNVVPPVPTNVRRSSRQRAPPPTRSAAPALPTKTRKTVRRRKPEVAVSAPAPAQPVASGSSVQLPGPPAGMKERERATRRTRAQVLEQMAPVMRRQCPRKGCGKKFGISREDDVAHIEEHYPDVTFKAQKVECLWTDCKHIEPRNVLVDHINAKHLRAEFRCLLHDDSNEMCTWSAPRPGDVNQHLERKHGRPKRRLEEGYVKEKNKKRRT